MPTHRLPHPAPDLHRPPRPAGGAPLGAWLLAVALAVALAAPGAAWALGPGDAAPEVQLPATRDARTGAQVWRLADMKGQWVYLDFWASWCGPCKQSFPWMNGLQQRLGPRGLQVVAINVDTHPEDARQFLANTPAAFRIAWDPAGDTPRRYAIKGMPSAVLIGPDGHVLAVHAGFHADEAAALEASIERQLPPSPTVPNAPAR